MPGFADDLIYDRSLVPLRSTDKGREKYQLENLRLKAVPPLITQQYYELTAFGSQARVERLLACTDYPGPPDQLNR